jgi:O-antigen ligase
MKVRLRKAITPAYLLLCLLLGGSVQAVWGNMALQILAVALIGWAALAPKSEPITRASELLLGLVALTVLLFVLQLVPLPPEIWTAIPGRQAIVTGYSTLGQPFPWLPVSITPHETLATAWTLLPPLAVFVGLTRLRAYEESWIAGTVILGAFLGVLLGALQTISGSDMQSLWYLFDVTNSGAVGFFANRNHMGTLLLVTIPFAAALFASGDPQAKGQGRTLAMLTMGAGGFLVVVVGLVLNGSLAAVALALPVIASSALILPISLKLRRLSIAATAIALVAALATLTTSPIHSDLSSGFAATSVQSRQEIWQRTGPIVAETFPVGTGIGSFQQVYALHEDPSDIEGTYINHAHNDYLELVLEAGLPGALLLLLFFGWWIRQTLRVWQSALSSRFSRAATIASAAILAHSTVDYPVRTAAIAAVFAACSALMAQLSSRVRSDRVSEVQRTRHLTIG